MLGIALGTKLENPTVLTAVLILYLGEQYVRYFLHAPGNAAMIW